VVEEMVKNKEVNITTGYESLKKYNIVGDFKFVVLQKILSQTGELGFIQRIVIDIYNLLRRVSLSEEKGFGLDSSFVTVERVPLVVAKTKEIVLKRLK
jgi:KUP system potassium uptake protein